MKQKIAKFPLLSIIGIIRVPGTVAAHKLMAICGEKMVGWVQYDVSSGRSVTLMGSWVDPVWRRRGVRTLLHENIRGKYQSLPIKTRGANAAGRAWLKATGFKQQRNGDWVLTANLPSSSPATALGGMETRLGTETGHQQGTAAGSGHFKKQTTNKL